MPTDLGFPCPCGRSFRTPQGRGVHQKKCPRVQLRKVELVSKVEVKKPGFTMSIASVTVEGTDEDVNAVLVGISKLFGGGK